MFQRQANEQSVEQRKIAKRFYTDLGMLSQCMQALLTNMDKYLVDQKAKGQLYLANGLQLTKTRDSLAASVSTIDGMLTCLRDAFQKNNYSLPPQYQFTHDDELLMLKPDELTKYYAAEITRITAVFAGYKTLMQQGSSLYNKYRNKQENSSSSDDAGSSISHRFGY